MPDEHGTLRPPLVLFQRLGGGTHHAAPRDDNYHLQPAEPAERRAVKVKKRPMNLGWGVGHDFVDAAREQERRWLELSKRQR